MEMGRVEVTKITDVERSRVQKLLKSPITEGLDREITEITVEIAEITKIGIGYGNHQCRDK